MSGCRRVTVLLVSAGLVWSGCGGSEPETAGSPATTVAVSTSEPGATPPPDSATPMLWVAGTADGEGRVAKVDGASGEIVALIEVGERPRQMALGLGALWVADCPGNRVYRIDPGTSTAVAEIETAGCPTDILVAERRVLVTTSLEPGLSVIDPDTNRIVDRISFDSSPTGMALGSLVIGLSHGWLISLDPETLEELARVEVQDTVEQILVIGDYVHVFVPAGLVRLYRSDTLAEGGTYDSEDPPVELFPHALAVGGAGVYEALPTSGWSDPDNADPEWAFREIPEGELPDGELPTAGVSRGGDGWVTTREGSVYIWRPEDTEAVEGAEMEEVWIEWGTLPFEPLGMSAASRNPAEGGYTPQACPGLEDTVPPEVISGALQDPAAVLGWGDIDATGLPRINLGTVVDDPQPPTETGLIYLATCP